MLATVRNRRGLVTSVEPFEAGTEGLIHLVSVEYIDPDGSPEDHLIWEREPGATLLQPTELPQPIRDGPMPPDEFDALVRATRWTALTPFIDPDHDGPLERLPLSSPFHGAIQVEDFQLVPLLKAMRMPRVSLLLADDVGLGKTIEAGLVLTELILRRRIRRVLVLCPASLRTQWKQEMRDKFSLSFDIVDRPGTHALQKRLGLDASPWRTFPRVITSYDYLKQPDILEQFRAACRMPKDSPHLPWDLLVVDEAHNLAPSSFGEDSDVSRMLKHLTPWFEHRLFLTATPHNGYTRSFTGLLECLDPVRFTRKSDPLTEAEKGRVEQVVVRRLKREINERSDPPRFAGRNLDALPLALSQEERHLAEAFGAFRTKVRALVATGQRAEQLAGAFAVEILAKRLLSCPVAFADSWHRYLDGLKASEDVALDEVRLAERAAREDITDDREAESRASHAARTVGAWLKPLAAQLAGEIAAVDRALSSLGLDVTDRPAVEGDPRRDTRFDRLLAWIDEHLRHSKRFRADERLVVFTEYKTTLDYLKRRLRAQYSDDGAVRVLFGGMEHSQEKEGDRDQIKAAFNDPKDPVRILVATDAAAEGLNLQETARYLLHYDIPWNPARLEQRNGRLDRHGQARDVTVFHFTSDDDADLKFLAYVASKVDTIREDLGSTGDVFDRAVERRLIDGANEEVVQRELDSGLRAARGRAEIPRDRTIETGEEAMGRLEALADELDLDPEALRQTLDVALGLHIGRPRLNGPDDRGRFRLVQPMPPQWIPLIDDTLRGERKGDARGALRALLFDAARQLAQVGPRLVFRPERDTVLLHLGHPLFHRALQTFARARFPGGVEAGRATRWMVRRGPIPDDAEAILLLTVEELAVNELRETFHHWVHTLRVPVHEETLGIPFPHSPARSLRLETDTTPSPAEVTAARKLWDEVSPDVKTLVDRLSADLTQRLSVVLEEQGRQAAKDENERFLRRQGEVSVLIEQSTIQRLEREIESYKREAVQGTLFDRESRLQDLERSIAEREEEVRRRRAHYEELREQLQQERDRVLRHILPKRYALRGTAQVFPVAIEIRLPEPKGGSARPGRR